MMVMLLWITYPDICHIIFTSLSCAKKEGANRLVKNLDTICWEAEHLKFIALISIPGIFIWVIGVPLFFLSKLRKYKPFLTNENKQ